MEALYLYCAAIAGTMLVLQVLLSLIGFGDHFHFDHVDHIPDPHIDLGGHGDSFDHGGGRFVGLFSFRAIVAGGNRLRPDGNGRAATLRDPAADVSCGVACWRWRDVSRCQTDAPTAATPLGWEQRTSNRRSALRPLSTCRSRARAEVVGKVTVQLEGADGGVPGRHIVRSGASHRDPCHRDWRRRPRHC